MNPQLQDPTLNTAECVVEGHKPNVTATGRSPYIRAILYISFVFTLLFGPLLALITLILFDKAESGDRKAESGNRKAEGGDRKADSGDRKAKRTDDKTMVEAVKWVCGIILLIEIALFITVIVLSADGNAPYEIYIILVIIFVEGFLMGVFVNNECFPVNFLPEKSTCCKCVSVLQLGVFLWANLTGFHFCWLVIGIMINALWGLTVLLFVFLVIAVSVFIVYNYLVICPNGFSCHNFVFCISGLCSVWLLIALVILAGQSFFGRHTADEVVKAVVLSVTTAFISWILPTIKEKDKSKKSKKNAKGKGSEKENLTEL